MMWETIAYLVVGLMFAESLLKFTVDRPADPSGPGPLAMAYLCVLLAWPLFLLYIFLSMITSGRPS